VFRFLRLHHSRRSPLPILGNLRQLFCLPYARLNEVFINSLVRIVRHSEIGLHAAAVDLSCFWQTIAAHMPRSGLMIRETRGCVVDPIALLFVFGVGFAVGYGVREWKSRKRRRRYTYLRETADEAPRVTS
jgi:hypothetical protein